MSSAARRARLLALAPDPERHFGEAGGVLSDARLLFRGALQQQYEVRVIDTLMRAHPPPGRFEWMAAAAGRFARTIWALATFQPDTVVALCSEGPSYYEKTLLLLCARLTGARTVVCPRSGFQERWLESSGLARTWMRITGRFVDVFVMQSTFWRDVHARYGIPAARMRVWYNCIDPEPWVEIARSRQPSSGRPFRFLFLGWAVKEKGLAELCDAADLLAGQGGAPFEVIVAGDGELGRALQRARTAGATAAPIVFLGWVDDVRRAEELRRADALILPTWAEGFPNALLEAMACALPVIATPVGAIPEVIEDGGTGLLVPLRRPDAIAAAMDRLRRDPEAAAAMGRRGHDRIDGRFDAVSGLRRFRAILADAS